MSGRPLIGMSGDMVGDTLTVMVPDSFAPVFPWEWDLVRSFLLIRQGWTCEYCPRPLHFKTVTIDHMVPQSKGGTDHVVNLVAACRSCNSSKGARGRDVFSEARR